MRKKLQSTREWYAISFCVSYKNSVNFVSYFISLYKTDSSEELRVHLKSLTSLFFAMIMSFLSLSYITLLALHEDVQMKNVWT